MDTLARAWFSLLLLLMVGHSAGVAQANSSVAQTPTELSGTVEGLVRGPSGEPFRNVEVFATELRRTGEVLARTRSDGLGMFVLGRLPLAACQVFAQAPGHTTSVVGAPLSVDQPHVAVDLRVYEANTVRGRVLDADGVPIPDVLVMGSRDSVRWVGGLAAAEARTDSDGRFELHGVPIGLSVYRAWKPGFALQHHWLTTSEDAEITMRMHRARGTELRITTAGLPPEWVADVQVHVHAKRGPAGICLPSDLRFPTLLESGSVALSGLLAAEWTVSLSHPNAVFRPYQVTTVAGDRKPLAHFEAIGDATMQLSGTVHLPDGTPLANRELLAHSRRSTWTVAGRVGQTKTDARGHFSMAASLVAGEEFTLRLVAPGYVLCQEKARGQLGYQDPMRWTLWEDQAAVGRELQLTATRAASVTAQVVAANGQAMAFAAVQLQVRYRDHWRQLAFATSQRDGSVHFPSILASDDEFRVAIVGMGGGDAVPFELKPAQRYTTVVQFEEPGTIRGRVVDAAGTPKAGVDVLLGDFEMGEHHAARVRTRVPTDRQGHFVFTRVGVGRHSLQVARIEAGLTYCEVESGKATVVELGDS
jgi:hypothetical protein